MNQLASAVQDIQLRECRGSWAPSASSGFSGFGGEVRARDDSVLSKMAKPQCDITLWQSKSRIRNLNQFQSAKASISKCHYVIQDERIHVEEALPEV